MDFSFKSRSKRGKIGGVARGEGRCENDVVGFLVRVRRSLDRPILSAKKEAKLSATEIHRVDEGKTVRVKKICRL